MALTHEHIRGFVAVLSDEQKEDPFGFILKVELFTFQSLLLQLLKSHLRN